MAKKATVRPVLKITKKLLDYNCIDHYNFDGVVQEFYDVVYEVVEVEKLVNQGLFEAKGVDGKLTEEQKKLLSKN